MKSIGTISLMDRWFNHILPDQYYPIRLSFVYISIHPEIIGFDSKEGLNVLATTGIALLF